jgi:hypothetical protein
MNEINTIREYLRGTAEFRRQAMETPVGFAYNSQEEFVLQRGETIESAALDDAETALVFAAVDRCGKRFALKECFYNAQLLALYDDSQELVYHEGYAVGHAGLPVLHGWVTVNDKVVDVTWRIEKLRSKGRLRNRIMGLIPSGWDYLGVGFQTEFLRERIVRRGQVWSVIDDWQDQWPALRGEYD